MVLKKPSLNLALFFPWGSLTALFFLRIFSLPCFFIHLVDISQFKEFHVVIDTKAEENKMPNTNNISLGALCSMALVGAVHLLLKGNTCPFCES